jgi:transposase
MDFMRDRLKVNKELIPHDYLMELYTSCNDGKLKIRLLAILHFWDGLSSTEVSKLLKISDFAVRQYLHRFNKFGLEGLKDLPKPIKEPKLSKEQLNKVDEIFGKCPRESGLDFNNWTIPLLTQWIKDTFNIEYSESNVYKIVEKLNYSKIRPRKRDKRVNQQALEDFKEKLSDIIEKKAPDTVILYEDEAVITSEPTLTSMWAKKGSHPIVNTDTSHSRKRQVVYGAVDPDNGQLVSMVADSGNSDNFKSFLK